MDETKIQLSADELLLMHNSGWILTKNSALDKISSGLGELSAKMQEHANSNQNSYDPLIFDTAKISRGEKYQGLPYLILDYPRLFTREDVLAIRTLFWWGKYFSVTLHTKGIWKELLYQRLLSSSQMFGADHYISIDGDEWNHDVNSEHYRPIRETATTAAEMTLLPGFIKITAIVQIGPWQEVEKKLFEIFVAYARLIER